MKTVKSRASSVLTFAATGLVVAFAIVVVAIYGMRPTPGTAFLVLGWMSILATGYFLVRAVGAAGAAVTPGEELTGDRREELQHEKKMLLKAIKEVEFDRDTGKLEGTEAEVAIMRYRGRALEILQLLDDEPSRQYEDVVEKELARRLAAEPPVPGACPSCAAPNDEDASFCKKCGVKLEVHS